jgi:hypothetical protein
LAGVGRYGGFTGGDAEVALKGEFVKASRTGNGICSEGTGFAVENRGGAG